MRELADDALSAVLRYPSRGRSDPHLALQEAWLRNRLRHAEIRTQTSELVDARRWAGVYGVALKGCLIWGDGSWTRRPGAQRTFSRSGLEPLFGLDLSSMAARTRTRHAAVAVGRRLHRG